MLVYKFKAYCILHLLLSFRHYRLTLESHGSAAIGLGNEAIAILVVCIVRARTCLRDHVTRYSHFIGRSYILPGDKRMVRF